VYDEPEYVGLNPAPKQWGNLGTAAAIVDSCFTKRFKCCFI
jgi:hypothetical protein